MTRARMRWALLLALVGGCADWERAPGAADVVPDDARYVGRAAVRRIHLDLTPASVAPAAGGDDIKQGLVAGPGRDLVIANCTACHSTALITQNHMSRARWDKTITWMQQTQNLWAIAPDARAQILDYLEATQGDDGGVAASAAGGPLYPPNPIW